MVCEKANRRITFDEKLPDFRGTSWPCLFVRIVDVSDIPKRCQLPEFPPVPLTLEGSSVLHQFFRFDWKAWRATPSADRDRIAAEAAAALNQLERANPDAPIQTALFSELGHKGDLIFVHFRDSLEALNQV